MWFDWSTFVPTLLATLTGAGVGIAGIVLAANLQNKAEYERRLDMSMSALIGATPARIAELDLFAVERERYSDYMDQGGDPDTVPNPEPAPYEMAVLLESARLLSRAEDQRVLAALADAFHALPGLPAKAQRARLSHLPEMIRKWRSGEWNDHRAMLEFNLFAVTARDRTGMTPPPPWQVG